MIQKKPYYKTFWFYAVMMIPLLFYAIREDNEPSKNTSNKSTTTQTGFASDLYVTKSGYFGAINKEYFDVLVKRIGQKDLAAIEKMRDAGVVFIVKEGLKVYKEGSSWGAVEVRPKGKVGTFWTFREVIRKN